MAVETPKSFEEQFPYMAAAQKAAEGVQPGNNLQGAAVADVFRVAIEAEVLKAFPETPTAVEADVDS